MKNFTSSQYTFYQSLRLAMICFVSFGAQAQTGVSDLATKLTNPVANLISVPFQFNYDRGMGADGKGSSTSYIFQPVVPIKLNANWNYILRPVITTATQTNVNGYNGTGVGPAIVETFFSPNTPGPFIWGVGPVVSTPSMSGNQFGTNQTGAGVSAVGLYLKAPWTAGILAYQTWGVGGSSVAGTANNSYWQPFVSYVTKDAWTYSVNTQSSFNWDERRAQNPVNASISKLVMFDKMPVSFSLGARYYLSSVPEGPTGWGARFSVTFLFPK